MSRYSDADYGRLNSSRMVEVGHMLSKLGFVITDASDACITVTYDVGNSVLGNHTLRLHVDGNNVKIDLVHGQFFAMLPSHLIKSTEDLHVFTEQLAEVLPLLSDGIWALGVSNQQLSEEPWEVAMSRLFDNTRALSPLLLNLHIDGPKANSVADQTDAMEMSGPPDHTDAMEIDEFDSELLAALSASPIAKSTE